MTTVGTLQNHHCFSVAGLEGAHVGADEVAGAVLAEGGFVLAADDGEGAQDVVGIFRCVTYYFDLLCEVGTLTRANGANARLLCGNIEFHLANKAIQ